MGRKRGYVYHSYTRTICPECMELVDGKIVYDTNCAYILRQCPTHGESLELLEEDAKWHIHKSDYDKPGTASTCQTKAEKGCPYDCGLCPSHDQHTCIGLMEITRRCDMSCPTCFAEAGKGRDLDLGTIEKMMDFYMASEDGKAEILQISGGEPTMHPEILRIISMAKGKGFKYVMLNTNGLRIAEDEKFVEALGAFKGGFEVYLQFDGLDDEVYRQMRGRPLLDVKKRAIANLGKHGVPATLVCTVDKGINDGGIGQLLIYGMDEKYVRGVNFQPVAYFGRYSGERNRITLSGILKRIEEQTGGLLKMSDFMPLPCDVDRVALTYLFKENGSFIPITRGKDMSQYRNLIGNTFVFTLEDTLKTLKDEDATFGLSDCCDLLADIKRHIPKGFIFKSRENKMKFVDENTFRISVSSFVDAWNFDMKSIQKDCVHVITPDLRRMPFSAFNMLHRGRYDEYYL